MADTTWTIQKCLEWTRGYLERRGDDKARLAAEWLVGAAAGLSRMELYLNFDRPLSPQELDRLHAMIKRRAAGEPLQYVIGETSFRTIDVACAPGVLIPRPETEMLVDEVLSYLDAHVLGQRKRTGRSRAVLAWNTQVAEQAAAEQRARAEAQARVEQQAERAARAAAAATGLDGEDAGDENRAPTAVFGASGSQAEDDGAQALGAVSQDAALQGAAPSDNQAGENAEARYGADKGGAGEPAGSASEKRSGASRTAAATADGEGSFSEPARDAAPGAGGAGGDGPETRVARVVEVGCGTGCIGLSLAAERPGAVGVLEIDIAPEACALTRKNRDALGLAGSVAIRQGDLLAPVRPAERGTFDALVSNPPYIPDEVMAQLPREVAAFEPDLALRGGADGLDVFRRLVAGAPGVLRPGGFFACELHETTLDDAAEICRAAGFSDVRVVRDLAGRPRFVTARMPAQAGGASA